MQKNGVPASPAAQPVPGTRFEPPRLRALGSLTELTKSLNPGSDTDFTHTSF